MPIWKRSGLGSSLLAFLMGTVMAVDKAAAQVAGTVGAVNKDATGTAPGKAAQPLSIGYSVVQNERLQTGAEGTAQIMFNDRSALNVGRNSTVVVDKFVYNPGAGAGEMALSMTRGVARLVGGQVSHTSGATIGTPAATIGVRGGNVTVLVSGAGTTVFVHNGVATAANRFGTQSIRTGYQLTIAPNGAPGTPTLIDIEQLRAATRQLASRGPQHGGAIRLPDAAQAARHGVGAPRAPARTPNFDLPAAGDDLIRSFTGTANQRIYP